MKYLTYCDRFGLFWFRPMWNVKFHKPFKNSKRERDREGERPSKREKKDGVWMSNKLSIGEMECQIQNLMAFSPYKHWMDEWINEGTGIQTFISH